MRKENNMKRNLIIIICVVMIIGISILVLWKTGVIFKTNNSLAPTNPKKEPVNLEIDTTKHVNIIKDNYAYLIKSEDGIYKDIDTKKEIFNPNEKYESYENFFDLIDIPEDKDSASSYLAEYSKYVRNIYYEETSDKFDNDIIASVVALSSSMYQPRTEKEVKHIAKKYFDIDNYELPAGTYVLKNYGKFTVAKENGYYFMSEIKDIVKHDKTVYIKDLEIKDSKMILTFDEANDSFLGGVPGCYTPIDPKEECTSGYYKVYFTKKSDSVMTVDKIEYSKNPNYVEKWIKEN